MTWTVCFTPEAERQADALDPPIRRRIVLCLARLAADPRSAANVKPLGDDRFRLRVCDWRVIYALRKEALIVLVLRVAHRREAYRP